MSINFQPDVCLPKDPTGFGFWRSGHYYEHVVLAQKCLSLAKPAIVPNYDIYSWRDEPELVQQWLVNHNSMHQAIRQATNVTGIDFSLVDFSKDDEFLSWMDDHASEHAAFRQILGIS
jgi:hypothetical protein